MDIFASPSAQTEGKFDGQPATLFYKSHEGADDGGLRYTLDPTSQWKQIATKDILACVPVHDPTGDAQGDYHFLYVEKNPSVVQDAQLSPVLFRSAILNSPPAPLLRDFVAPAKGPNNWESRQDHDAASPNFHVIVSTASGTGLAGDVWHQLVKPALQYLHVQEGKHYKLHFTSSENSVSEFTRDILLPQANRGVRQSLLLMSGDGGVVDIVNTLLSGQRDQSYQKPNIALLALGTGNALAHSAGLTEDNSLGLKAWLRGSEKELPLFCATFSPGARLLCNEAREERPLNVVDGVATAHGSVVASWGLHAGLVADSDTAEYRKFGVERFKMAVKEALYPSDGFPPHVYKAEVSIQRSGQPGWNRIRQEEHAYVLATLVSQLEKGFTISPASRQLDGKLRLVHFGPMQSAEVISVLEKAYQGGQHVNDERVGYEEIDVLRIGFKEEEARWRRVCIDGKIIRVEKDGWVEVRAGQKGVVDLVV